jgi:hypothetical protein
MGMSRYGSGQMGGMSRPGDDNFDAALGGGGRPHCRPLGASVCGCNCYFKSNTEIF